MAAFNLSDAGFLADPYPTYARMRAEGPLLPLMPRVWMACRYRAADSALRDGRLGRDFASAVRLRYGPGIMDEPAFRMVGRFLLLMNPPEHTRLRALLSRAFGVKQAAELRSLADAEAVRLIDGLAGQREADLVRAFNYPLPIAVICAMLGLGDEDRAMFSRETSALVKVLEINPLGPAEIAEANAAAGTFEAYFREVLRQRRRSPGFDLISLLLLAEDGDDRLSESEIIANITLLFLAGHETTANQLGNALYSLFCHPDALASLRAEPARVSAAVDEALRFESSVHIAARAVFDDIELDGVGLRRGDVLYINLGSANRDADVFDEPDRYRLRSATSIPKPLSFGGGIHYCLGARLARIELETGLSVLLSRFPHLRLMDGAHPNWKPTLTIRGLDSLPVVW